MIRSPEARSRARQLLKMLGLTKPPVEVDQIASALGFTVLPFEFPDSTSAVTFIEGDVKSIGVNSRHAPTRQRFSVAHELGHYLSGHESYDGGKAHVEVERRASSFTSQAWQEIEANEFASELLMPERFLRQDVARLGLTVPALAKRYRVSEQAMWIQLTNLEIAGRRRM